MNLFVLARQLFLALPKQQALEQMQRVSRVTLRVGTLFAKCHMVPVQCARTFKAPECPRT